MLKISTDKINLSCILVHIERSRFCSAPNNPTVFTIGRAATKKQWVANSNDSYPGVIRLQRGVFFPLLTVMEMSQHFPFR